jgi:hypothetical protein
VEALANRDGGISETRRTAVKLVRVSANETKTKVPISPTGIEGPGAGDLAGRIIGCWFSDNAEDDRGRAVGPGAGVLRPVNVALAGNDGEAVDPDPDQITLDPERSGS